jgi:hypothetical protein
MYNMNNLITSFTDEFRVLLLNIYIYIYILEKRNLIVLVRVVSVAVAVVLFLLKTPSLAAFFRVQIHKFSHAGPAENFALLVLAQDLMWQSK